MSKSKGKTEIRCNECNTCNIYTGGAILWYKDKPICRGCYDKLKQKEKRTEV